MTHDELLIEINRRLDVAYYNGDPQSMRALRAVVELHKPDEPDFPDEWESCVECSGNGYEALYPCQTIKVIEKELS